MHLNSRPRVRFPSELISVYWPRLKQEYTVMFIPLLNCSLVSSNCTCNKYVSATKSFLKNNGWPNLYAESRTPPTPVSRVPTSMRSPVHRGWLTTTSQAHDATTCNCPPRRGPTLDKPDVLLLPHISTQRHAEHTSHHRKPQFIMNTAHESSSSQHHSTDPIVTDVRTGQETRQGGSEMRSKSSGPDPGMGARALDDPSGSSATGMKTSGGESSFGGCRKMGRGNCDCPPGTCKAEESMGKK
jgi:hypothetical protein